MYDFMDGWMDVDVCVCVFVFVSMFLSMYDFLYWPRCGLAMAPLRLLCGIAVAPLWPRCGFAVAPLWLMPS